MDKIVTGAPAPLHALCPGLDGHIIGIVDRALQKAPQDRYPNMNSMKQEIAAVRRRLE